MKKQMLKIDQMNHQENYYKNKIKDMEEVLKRDKYEKYKEWKLIHNLKIITDV